MQARRVSFPLLAFTFSNMRWFHSLEVLLVYHIVLSHLHVIAPLFCTFTAIAPSQAILEVYDGGTAENLWQLLLSFSKERFRIMWLGSERIRQCKVPSAIYRAFAKVVLGYVSRQQGTQVQVVQRCINFHATERGECKL